LPGCERLFVPEYGYTVTEHEPDKPWLVLGSEHRTITLEEGPEFFTWGAPGVAGAAVVGSARSVAAHARVALAVLPTEVVNAADRGLGSE
jgi:hypothetical protein